MFELVSKIIGGLVVGLILLVGVLQWVKGSPSADLTQRNLLARAYLDKNKDAYAKCYNSIHHGGMLVGDVKLKYLYGVSDAMRAKLDRAEDDFIADITKECEKPVADYESNFETLKKTDGQIALASRSKLDVLLSHQPEPADYSSYEPKMVRLFSGDPFTNLTFTEAEVKDFYSQRMGY